MNYVPKKDSGFRDERISRWHKSLGYDLPACDLDCIICMGTIIDDQDEGFRLLEYNHSVAVALIDYKNQHARIDLGHPSIKAQADLAGDKPSFVVGYKDDFSRFRLYPTNAAARAKTPKRKLLNECEFIYWLYWLRGIKAPRESLIGRNREKVEE